jgi:hypothetical protein
MICKSKSQKKNANECFMIPSEGWCNPINRLFGWDVLFAHPLLRPSILCSPLYYILCGGFVSFTLVAFFHFFKYFLVVVCVLEYA